MKLQGIISKTWYHLVKQFAVFDTKKNAVFEGMYGFVGKEYFHLVNPWCGTYYLY